MVDETPGNDYPMMLYKGGPVDPNGYDESGLETTIVADADGEAAARKGGYSSLAELAVPAKGGK